MPRRPFPGVGAGRGSMRVTPHSSSIKEASTPNTAASSGNSTPSMTPTERWECDFGGRHCRIDSTKR